MRRQLLVYLTLFDLLLAVNLKAEYRLVGNSFCGGCLLRRSSAVAIAAGFQFYEQPCSIKNTKTGMAEMNTPPLDYQLCQNYPNPFNPTTTIEFSLPSQCHVSLKIYSLLGEEVSVLFDEPLPAGVHKKSWNGDHLANGAYYYVLKTSNFQQSRVALLLK
jgi:hypothetical protein